MSIQGDITLDVAPYLDVAPSIDGDGEIRDNRIRTLLAGAIGRGPW